MRQYFKKQIEKCAPIDEDTFLKLNTTKTYFTNIQINDIVLYAMIYGEDKEPIESIRVEIVKVVERDLEKLKDFEFLGLDPKGVIPKFKKRMLAD